MSDERPPTGNSPPADDLRAVIAASLADEKTTTIAASPSSASPDAADTGAAPGAMAAAEGGVGQQPDGEPAPRRPQGRPDTGSGGAPEGDKPLGAGDGAGAPGAPEGGAAVERGGPQPEAAGTPAPEHWSAADKAQFAALPEAARTPFLDMYRRMEAGFTPKLQRGAQLERDYGDLDRVIFTPDQRQILTQRGMTPAQLINGWADVERGLMGPRPGATVAEQQQALEVKHQIVARIIHNYQADPARVAAILNELRGFAVAAGGDRAAPPAPGGNGFLPAGAAGTAAPGIDPVLHQRLTALETESQQEKQRREMAEYARAGDQIQAFANETDSAGQLKHPFFAELEAEMTSLAQFERIQGKAPVLQDLYDRALWANPSTRQRQQALDEEAKTKRAQEERRAKAEQARRAGSSVTGAPGPGQMPGPGADMSLRDQIKANMNGGGTTSGGPGRI